MESIRKRERRLAFALGVAMLAAAVAAGPAHATSASTDASDLWWNPAESGWGVQLNQQHGTIFATLFVYAQSGQPEFYVATLAPTATPYVWTGTAYRTTGPWWGAPFNPAFVHETPAGAMTFQMLSVGTATLDTTIGGVRVVKSVQRMSFANDRLDGIYLGGAKQRNVSGPCPSVAPTETGVSISHGGDSTLSAVMVTPTSSCSMPAGTYQQHGRFGYAVGNYSCANGETGTIALMEIKVTVDALTFRFRSTGAGPGYACTMEGDFAGVQP